jgi:hypothetical protein
MRKESLAALVTILVVAGLATGYLAISGARSPATTISDKASVPSASTGNADSPGSAVGNETIFIRVVNSTSGGPILDAAVRAGPASSATDITPTQSFGYTLNQCVHEVGNGSVVSPSENVAVSNTTTTTFAPCPLKDYDTNATGWVTISNQNATYFLVEAYAPVPNAGPLGGPWPNGQVVTIQGSQTFVTVPLPEGNFTVSSSG